ncbi:MAG: division/cell wall cluster transcriptional repressor MraZ [Planctomycetes bacterium]|nr:division/cell wall cluster transcriptional repressor MraZ [Planctomycetota bacterium]
MILTGTFVRSIDEKLRVALPKRLRDDMVSNTGRDLFITRNTDASLSLYTEEGLTAMAQRLTPASPVQQDVHNFSRLFYSQTERVEVDSQGRFRIPPALAQLARLTKELVMIGVGDHVELWDKQAWEDYSARISPNFDQLAQRAFEQGAASRQG